MTQHGTVHKESGRVQIDKNVYKSTQTKQISLSGIESERIDEDRCRWENEVDRWKENAAYRTASLLSSRRLSSSL